ncbi:hypothetical protein [Geodermatophilus sp. FMUSA9-8]|uniref:hypothetical protein n=1 Tax=Geodermatophilus sp. FMUSA9-8 TaxID=3120155 RepID=UPI00300981E0
MRRGLPWAVAAFGLSLVVAGIAVFWWTNTHPVPPSGWSAYAPLEADRAYESRLTLTVDSGWVSWSGGHLTGAGLAVVGALVLAGLGGWALGRRSGRRAGR